MARFVEVLRLDERTTVEVNPLWGIHCAKQQLHTVKRRLIRPLKRFTQWGLGIAVKTQIGNFIGSLSACLCPTLAINAALLVALVIFQLVLHYPELSSLVWTVLGLTIGVLSNV